MPKKKIFKTINNMVFRRPQNDAQKRKLLSDRVNQKLEGGVCKKLIPEKWSRIPCKFEKMWMLRSGLVKKQKKRQKSDVTMSACGAKGSIERCDKYLSKLTTLLGKVKTHNKKSGLEFKFRKILQNLKEKAEARKDKYHPIADLNATLDSIVDQ
jgi:hypothetical protein